MLRLLVPHVCVWFGVLGHGGAVVIAMIHPALAETVTKEGQEGKKHHPGDQSLPKTAMTMALRPRATALVALTTAAAL